MRSRRDHGGWAAGVLVLAVAAIAAAGCACAQTETGRELSLLTAIGSSEVNVRPDEVEVRLGVETEAPTATQARQENALRAGKVVDSLRALGIPEQAIETSVFQIYPVRRFEDESGRGEPPIVGYRVTNIVGVRTGRLDLAPRIIDDSVRAGANRVDSVSFVLRDEAPARETALRLAVANARENARIMAGELGVELVRVHGVQQGGVGVTQLPPFFRGAAAEAGAPSPIFPGEITVRGSVTLTYVVR